MFYPSFKPNFINISSQFPSAHCRKQIIFSCFLFREFLFEGDYRDELIEAGDLYPVVLHELSSEGRMLVLIVYSEKMNTN